MIPTIFDFNEQLSVGELGENIFCKVYKNLNPSKSQNKKIDFIIGKGKQDSVELKTDTYNMAATDNFFMERFSDINSQSLGGPWRAHQDGVKFFVYFFISDGIFFWFETKKLCETLDDIIAKQNLKIKKIKNKSWVTGGYLINRELLKDIVYQQDNINITKEVKEETVPF